MAVQKELAQTCMILVDGKAMRACLPTTAKANGKNILTVEGLSEKRKDVFVWAFQKLVQFNAVLYTRYDYKCQVTFR